MGSQSQPKTGVRSCKDMRVNHSNTCPQTWSRKQMFKQLLHQSQVICTEERATKGKAWFILSEILFLDFLSLTGFLFGGINKNTYDKMTPDCSRVSVPTVRERFHNTHVAFGQSGCVRMLSDEMKPWWLCTPFFSLISHELCYQSVSCRECKSHEFHVRLPCDFLEPFCRLSTLTLVDSQPPRDD